MRKHVVLAAVLLLATTSLLARSEEHTSELQSLAYLVCRLLLEKKKQHVRSHRLGKADHSSESPETNERGVESERFSMPANHKNRFALVPAPVHVFFDPLDCPLPA